MRDDFETKVCQQMRLLKEEAHDELSVEVAAKRIGWLRSRNRQVARSVTPREAYELFLIDYLGLGRESVPIVSEKDDEIVWDSMNDCPTLEACIRMGLDTRQVCRTIYEKSTQAFLSALDPQFRFWRSYELIRPHSTSCREAIFKLDFEAMMRLAIHEAELARSEGNVASGAVLVHRREVTSTGQDTVSAHHEANAHAAMHAIREATEVLGNADLGGGILFATTEPCPRCMELAAETNLTSIVFGTSVDDVSALDKRRDHLNGETVGKEGPNWIEMIGGILKEECALLRAR